MDFRGIVSTSVTVFHRDSRRLVQQTTEMGDGFHEKRRSRKYATDYQVPGPENTRYYWTVSTERDIQDFESKLLVQVIVKFVPNVRKWDRVYWLCEQGSARTEHVNIEKWVLKIVNISLIVPAGTEIAACWMCEKYENWTCEQWVVSSGRLNKKLWEMKV